MKFLLFVIYIFSATFTFCQSPIENLEKYWTYRDRLRKNFLKIGDQAGESIPMTARRVDWAFSGQDASPWPDARAVYYSDATIYLGHYIMVLATEYKLTNDQILAGISDDEAFAAMTNQKTQTQNELYYALQAINRIDLKAENYLSGSSTKIYYSKMA